MAASTQARAQDITIPLPTGGLFVDAKTGQTSPIFAAELHNFSTDGILLELRPEAVIDLDGTTVLQRVPYTFGASPRYIDLRSIQAECDGVTFARQFDGSAMTAYLSSQALIADGLDMPLRYNGTTFTAALFTTTTGANVQDFDGVLAHHDRPYFWRTNGTLEFYYGDVGAVTGALERYPLDRLGNITGNMMTAVSVTLDAGENSNDALAIYTTTGMIVVFEGLDPGDANNWGLSTRIQVAPPLSRFGITRVGADVWVLTAKGIVSLRDTVSQGQLALANTVARPISDEILRLAQIAGAEWQLHTSADGSRVIINYFTDDLQKQFIWQADSKAWQTADYPARFWHNLGLKTQFTTPDGHLGEIIDSDDATEEITAVWHTGWFSAGGDRTVVYVRPTIIAKEALTVKVTVLRDYNETDADIAEAEQTITIEPETPPNPGRMISLNEDIAIGVTGQAFQLRIEVTATWAQIVSMKVGIE